METILLSDAARVCLGVAGLSGFVVLCYIVVLIADHERGSRRGLAPPGSEVDRRLKG